MWVDYKKAPNLMMAEMWKEVLEAEGLPVRLLPEGDILDYGELVPFRVMVPRGREHVADEILRKL
jgi:aromatic ring-opening dioxygenase catalytic subunit (LigB family)